MLTVVIGPPASGKTTWVLQHAKQGDIIIDYDRLATALTAPGNDPHNHTPTLNAVTRAASLSSIGR